MMKKGGSADLTVHVNMAPMIDFLVITIAFLLMSASFFSVGMIDSLASAEASATANSNLAGATATPEARVLEIVIGANSEIKATIVGQNERTQLSFGSSKEDLKARLAGEQFTSITLNAETGIHYGEVVQLLSELRSMAPQVSLNVESR